MHTSGDGFMAGSIRRKSRFPGRSREDDDNLTFDMDGFSVRKPNLVEIRLALLGDSDLHTDTHTHRQIVRQLSFICV